MCKEERGGKGSERLWNVPLRSNKLWTIPKVNIPSQSSFINSLLKFYDRSNQINFPKDIHRAIV